MEPNGDFIPSRKKKMKQNNGCNGLKKERMDIFVILQYSTVRIYIILVMEVYLFAIYKLMYERDVIQLGS
jgi:hypothetical protein